MSLLPLLHSILTGVAVSVCIDLGKYSIAAGVFAATVIQLMWAILERDQ